MPGLLGFLSNHLILTQTAPHLPLSALFNLARTSHAFYELLYDSPGAWRRLDLSTTKAACYSAEFSVSDVAIDLSENQSPLLQLAHTSHKLNILTHTQILILDTAFVPADVLRIILLDDAYHIRILSLLQVHGLDPDDFAGIIQFLSGHGIPSRVSRRLEGIYYFGEPLCLKTWPVASASSLALEQDGSVWVPSRESTNPWYQSSGLISQLYSIHNPLLVATTTRAIAWDAVACRGPKLNHKGKWQLASMTLGPDGCCICHTSPEGPGAALDELPLLEPPPLHEPHVRLAQQPPLGDDGKPLRFFARCPRCVTNRRCHGCGKWWCEECYQVGGPTCYQKNDVRGEKSAGVKIVCEECEECCYQCNSRYQKVCPKCGNSYCLRHRQRGSYRPEDIDLCDSCRYLA